MQPIDPGHPNEFGDILKTLVLAVNEVTSFVLNSVVHRYVFMLLPSYVTVIVLGRLGLFVVLKYT